MKNEPFSSKVFFDSLKKYSDLNVLIHDGVAENQFLECKLVGSPSNFSQKLEAELSEELSGFANTDGGVIAFGLDTDNKREIDIITQICPIAEINQFESKFKIKAPLLVTPQLKFETKILKKKKTDSKGVLLIYIYPTNGDPIQSTKDGLFFIRVGDKTPKMPYEILKRMIRGTSSPDLKFDINLESINYKKDNNLWEIPISLINESNYPAKNTKLLLFIPEQKNIVDIVAPGYQDIRKINQNNKKGWYFSENINGNIYKGLALSLKPINIKMANKKNKATLNASIYSEGMAAKVFTVDLYLIKSGKIPEPKIREEFLY